MFPLIYGLLLFTCQGWMALSSPAKYDQRQEGDVNVQIDLKDVKIIALLKSDIFDDYTNYDYAYDYADFTIKPVVKPTKPPTTTTKTTTTIRTSSASSETSAALLPSSSSLENKTTESDFSSTSATTVVTDSTIVQNSTTSIEISADDLSLIKLKNEDQPENLYGKIVNATEKASSASNEALAEKPVLVHKQTKRCRAGYDKFGKCHRRRISLLPLAMKVAPELLRSMRQRLIH